MYYQNYIYSSIHRHLNQFYILPLKNASKKRQSRYFFKVALFIEISELYVWLICNFFDEQASAIISIMDT